MFVLFVLIFCVCFVLDAIAPKEALKSLGLIAMMLEAMMWHRWESFPVEMSDTNE